MGGCFSGNNNKGGEMDEQPRYVSSKVRPSDEDRGPWVGECDVDTKASAFIAKIHETRIVDLKSHENRVMAGHERQTA